MKKHALSILIPNYNHAPYLRETIDSVLTQDFDDFEVIVGDDGSTDHSAEILRSYGQKIRPLFFNKNRGYFAVVADLLKEVRSEYVHIFSSDDLYMPGYLARSMALIECDKVQLTCSDIRYFSPSGSRDVRLLARIPHTFPDNAHALPPDLGHQGGGVVLTQHCPHHPDDQFQASERRFASKEYEKCGLATDDPKLFGPNEIVNVLRHSNFWVPGVACITKLEHVRRYGPLNPSLENISDWFLFHTIALNEGIGYVPQVGVAMREQEHSYTKTVKKDRARRNRTYWTLLDLLSQDRLLRQKFRNSGQITFVLDTLFWKLIFRPKWWDFFWYSKSSVMRRLWNSLKKRLGVLT